MISREKFINIMMMYADYFATRVPIRGDKRNDKHSINFSTIKKML